VDPVRIALSHPGLALAAAAAAVVVAIVVSFLTGRGPDRRAACSAALIPAYLAPAAVADLVQGSHRPRVVVINPHSGPGAKKLEAYRRAVREVQAAGTRVLGYVATGHAALPLTDVVANVDRYLSWYHVDGIFFDEAASGEAQLPYYRTLARHAHGAERTVVLNPGVVPAPGYFDVADTVVTYEGPYAGYARALGAVPDWLRRQPRERVAHLVYDASRAQALEAARGRAAGYVYATSGTLPNPWRALPPYLHDEEEVLASCA
jgi:hypothetical protein